MNGLTVVAMYLLSLGFGIVILGLWLRIAMRFYKISSVSPIGQLITLTTNPIVSPLHAIIPDTLKRMTRIDLPAFCVLLIVELIKILSLSLLVFHAIMPIAYVLIYTVADFIKQPCDIIFFALLIRVIMSFVNPQWHHPFAEFLKALTDPFIIMGRKIIPNISGFDFSPFIMMLIVKVISLFIAASLPVNLI